MCVPRPCLVVSYGANFDGGVEGAHREEGTAGWDASPRAPAPSALTATVHAAGSKGEPSQTHEYCP